MQSRKAFAPNEQVRRGNNENAIFLQKDKAD